MNNNELEQIVSRVVKEQLCPADITEMTLALAKRLALRVEAKAKEMGVKPVVAISNTSARPVLVECTDDSYIASYDVALQKAYTVVALKMSTKKLKTLAQPGESLYGIQFTNNGQIVIFGGGVPLIYRGKIIGGLGVSGGSEEQDTALADFGASVLEEEIKCL
ncbi:MAG: heme-binding protein [Clostridia bacterium]|nr:heme-binding protein [Clostridia bacterium]